MISNLKKKKIIIVLQKILHIVYRFFLKIIIVMRIGSKIFMHCYALFIWRKKYIIHKHTEETQNTLACLRGLYHAMNNALG